MSTSAPPRTLADQLRSWSDEQVRALLRARPDLATPAPRDSAQLASRAGARASVQRAADQLDLLGLVVAESLGTLPTPCTLADVQARVNAAPERVAARVRQLRAWALVWGPDDELRPLSTLTTVVGTALTGLGPSAVPLLTEAGPKRVFSLARDLGLGPSGDPVADAHAIAGHLTQPHQVAALLSEVTPQARRILDHLRGEGSPGASDTADLAATRASAASPVEELLARGLLMPRDRRNLVVPAEVSVALNGGTTTAAAVDTPPEIPTTDRDSDLVDRAAAGAAFELVRRVELLLEQWGVHPPAVLRSGGLSLRDLKATAELLHLTEPEAALLVELAAEAGLLATGEDADGDPVWLPSDTYDVWAAGSAAGRWARLALAWLETARPTGLVGRRDESGRTLNALAPTDDVPWLPGTRTAVLAELAELASGRVLAAGTGVPALVERLRWLRPRRPALRARAVAWTVEEAAFLGVTGLGGLPRHGAALLGGEDPRHEAAAALEPLLPEPVDHVLLQADLTAVAPGPLDQDLARRLAVLADVESRGGATVYRFTASSVRRAFDAGWSTAEITGFVEDSSRTPVPQPLRYLVEDVARRFGTVRAGVAESFLRSDDEAALTELVHHPKATSLRLRRIAPTVVVSDVPLDVLLPRLRELGTAPVVEAADGSVQLTRRDSMRARSARRPSLAGHGPVDPRSAARTEARLAATVTAIRAGDRAAEHRPPNADVLAQARTSPVSTIALLREAVEGRRSVWIGYVDNHGVVVERVVDPVKVDGGWLTAHDHRSDDVRSFAVHRITAVSPVES